MEKNSTDKIWKIEITREKNVFFFLNVASEG